MIVGLFHDMTKSSLVDVLSVSRFLIGTNSFHGDVAQLGERLARTEKVAGSTPVISTSFRNSAYLVFIPFHIALLFDILISVLDQEENNMSKNTEITVLYRDGSNYKKSISLLVAGTFPESLHQAIESAKVGFVHEDFIDLTKTSYGSIVGMFPELDYDDEIDHDFVTLEISPTEQAGDITQQEFANLFGLQWKPEVDLVNGQKKADPSPSL